MMLLFVVVHPTHNLCEAKKGEKNKRSAGRGKGTSASRWGKGNSYIQIARGKKGNTGLGLDLDIYMLRVWVVSSLGFAGWEMQVRIWEFGFGHLGFAGWVLGVRCWVLCI